MPSPVADLFADLSQAFTTLDVEWYLFGAQAAIVYGVARLTADVDVTIKLPDRLAVTTVVESLEKQGFVRRVDRPGFLERSRVLPFVHTTSGLPLDVVLAGPGIEDDFFARATTHLVDGVSVRVADVTDLIVMKVLAGRSKDLEDVVTLLRVQAPAVDLPRARMVLRALESALGQSDLIPALERAIVRAKDHQR